MKKNRWSNLFGTVLAGATVGTVAIVSKKMAKKYGQKPKTQKLLDTGINQIINAAVDTFLDTDSDKIDKIMDLIR